MRRTQKPRKIYHFMAGAHIEAARIKKGWSVKELSQESGVSIPALYNLQRGYDVELKKFIEVVKALGCSLDAIYYGEDFKLFKTLDTQGLSTTSQDCIYKILKQFIMLEKKIQEKS